MTDPLFIAVEGIDGAGKTSLCDNLRRLLPDRFTFTSEPHGDVPRGSPQSAYVADRKVHCRGVITPALAGGRSVITDRYWLSTRVATDEPVMAPPRHPDLYIHLATPPSIAWRRLQHRGGRDARLSVEALEAMAHRYRCALQSVPTPVLTITSPTEQLGLVVRLLGGGE